MFDAQKREDIIKKLEACLHYWKLNENTRYIRHLNFY